MLESAARSLSIVMAAIEWKSLLPALAALAGVWIQSRLSTRNTFNAKLWELRREAYAEFLGSLYSYAGRAEALVDLLDGLEDKGLPIPPKQSKELKELMALSDQLSAITTRGSLVWSREFSDVAYRWREEWASEHKDKGDREYLRSFAVVTDKLYEAMHQAARADLGRR